MIDVYVLLILRQINENQQAALTGEVKLGEMTAPLAMLPPPAAFAHSTYYGGESSSSGTALQLMSAAPQLQHADLGFRLQPTQPNLQDPAAACGGLHGHGLQLW
jgi:hypothetical protein